jgi:hypothetical protein
MADSARAAHAEAISSINTNAAVLVVKAFVV